MKTFTTKRNGMYNLCYNVTGTLFTVGIFGHCLYSTNNVVEAVDFFDSLNG